MTYRKLNNPEIKELYEKDRNQSFFTSDKREVRILRIDDDPTKDSLHIYLVYGKADDAEYKEWEQHLYLLEPDKIRHMKPFEVLKKVEELSSENASLEGEIWLVKYEFTPRLPQSIPYWGVFIDVLSYAKYDMDGIKLTPDYKFEIIIEEK